MRTAARARLLLAGALLLLAADAPAARAESAGLLIRFGMKDAGPTRWDGRVSVEPGRVIGVRGWRFREGDAAIADDGWRASTRHPREMRRSNRPDRQRAFEGPPLDNGVTVTLADVGEDSRVRVTTEQGDFEIRLGDLRYGEVASELAGAVEVERTAAATPLPETPTDDDFPAAAIDGDGRVHLAWVRFTPRHGHPRILELAKPPADFSFLAEAPGGDQVLLGTLPLDESSVIAITEPGRDVYKCAVAIDGRGRTWVFWSERQDGRFDVWARAVEDGVAAAPVRLSSGRGNDHSPVATTDAEGNPWVAWQGDRDGVFRIVARRGLEDGTFAPERVVSEGDASSWAPAIAASRPGKDGSGRVAITWDTYGKGDYDVWVRELDAKGEAQPARPVANSPRYEARSTAAYDDAGNLWVAWEESGATWGKDRGLLVQGKGVGLMQNRRIGLVVRGKDGTWREPAEPLSRVMPGPRLAKPPPREEGEPLSEAARAAAPWLGKPYHNLSRLAVDASGRPWLLFRSRALDFSPTVGSMWLEYAAYYEGETWTGPILVPGSDNLLYSAPAVVTPPGGGLRLVYATDHRQERVAKKADATALPLASEALTDPWVNDLVEARLDVPGPPAPATLREAKRPPEADAEPSEATVAERSHAAHARAARTSVRGEELRLVRGEFHRHTELSSDGGADGPLEDMWRYAIDVAALDWVGNGDHDNGHGREYPWWLIQKTTDAFQIPGRFTTLFSYERSRPFPEGHRNVVFARRGIRPLPRLPLAKESDEGPAPDTAMLYRYLHELGGISAPHTTGTTMGTDWRNHDPEVEPLVEIYQGARNSYEMPGAPRTATGRNARGERKEGFVSNALAKGHRLGFISSSDHHSTHISYAMVWVDEPGRETILDALRRRRAYAATDDIVADVRAGEGDDERFLGETLTTTEPATLDIRLEGTAPFAKVVVVKDGAEVRAFTPGERSVRLSWTDPDPETGRTSSIYVRGEQEDGELVWTSPIWVAYEAEP